MEIKNIQPEIRKAQGWPHSLYLCLPRFWTRQQMVEKGDRLHIYAQPDGSLKIIKEPAE